MEQATNTDKQLPKCLLFQVLTWVNTIIPIPLHSFLAIPKVQFDCIIQLPNIYAKLT